MKRLAVLCCLVLAGCGVDGPPQAPERDATPGLTISGTAEFGVTGGRQK